MNSENNLIFEKYAQSLKEATLGTGTMTAEQLKDYLTGIKKMQLAAMFLEN